MPSGTGNAWLVSFFRWRVEIDPGKVYPFLERSFHFLFELTSSREKRERGERNNRHCTLNHNRRCLFQCSMFQWSNLSRRNSPSWFKTYFLSSERMIGVRLSISRYSRSDGTVSGRNGTLSRLFFSFFSFSRFVARLSLIVLWLFIHLFFYRFRWSGLMDKHLLLILHVCLFCRMNCKLCKL